MLTLLRTLAEAGVLLSLRPDGQLQAQARPGVLDAGLRALISRHRDDLTVLLAQRSAIEPDPGIPRRDQHGPAPASFAQQQLWFLDRYQPGSTAYHIPLGLRLTGPGLDRIALQHTLDVLLLRHEVLRTTFMPGDDVLLQIVQPTLSTPLRYEDLSALAPTEREAQVDARVRSESGLAFDLEQGPLLRARLLRLQPEEHVLLLTLHHIIADGWSMGVLVDEAMKLLHAQRHGRALDQVLLHPLPIQYVDYAAWQQRRLQGPPLGLLLDYWRGRLEGAPPQIRLPLDHPRPSIPRHRGDSIPLLLSPATTHALTEIARSQGATLFMVLLAAFKAWIYRCSGEQDISVGTPVAGRIRPELEGLIGCFVNTLVLRDTIRGEDPFTTVLRQVRDTALQAFAHQELPFERLVESLQPERHRTCTPLFQVMFSLQNTPTSRLELPGLRIDPVATPPPVKFDLECAWMPHADGLQGSLIYDADLFEADTVRHWAKAYACLLEGVCLDPHRPVAQLPLMATDWGPMPLHVPGSTAPQPPPALLHTLFAAQVARCPQAPAVVAAGVRLSYAELDRRAARVAQRLLQLGVRPDDCVGLCVGRNAYLLIGILGILKAGAAYVPLDPDYPPERLAHIAADSRPVAILSQDAGIAEQLRSQAPVLTLDDLAEDATLDAQVPLTPPSNLNPSHLAYVIYTSGSTGLPKGVMVEHRSLVNFHAAMLDSTHAHCPAGMHVTLNASFAFDMSLMAILQLLSGHCIHLLPQTLRTDGTALCRYLQEQRIDIFDCTPSQLEPLLAAGLLDDDRAHVDHPASYPPLHRPRRILLGGEAIPPTLWQRLQACDDIAFFNVYGPTECTVAVTLHPINRSERQPHLGHPIRQARLYVLDACGQPLPPGAIGEIHVAGQCLARGYLHRPDLTAERYLADPFDPTPGARMYRTGDLGRWRSDGGLIYHGRNDTQVKLRGHRIELAEVEHALARIAGVDGAVVALVEAGSAAHLAAYYTGTVEPDEVCAQARQLLPSFMMPASVQRLPCLPLTANGKLDREALPAPDALVPAVGYDAPVGDTEQRLASVWCSVLGLERVGRNHHFFEIGGHSLSAMRVQAHVREAFGVEVAVTVLFDQPILADFAAIVDALRLTGPHGSVDAAFEDPATLSDDALEALLAADGRPPANA